MAMAVPKDKGRAHGTAPGGACDPELPTAKRARTHAQTAAHSEDESEHERAEMEEDIAPEDLQARMELSAKKKATKRPVFGRTKRNSTQSQYEGSRRLFETFCTKSGTEARRQHDAHNPRACTRPTRRLRCGEKVEVRVTRRRDLRWYIPAVFPMAPRRPPRDEESFQYGAVLGATRAQGAGL